MKNNQYKSKQTPNHEVVHSAAAVIETAPAAVNETAPAVVIETAPAAVVEKAPEAPAVPAVTEKRVVDPRVFTAVDETFKAGRGLATEVFKALPGTATSISDALLASGVYQKVAPQAAKLRPVKPVETLLIRWLAKGKVTAA